MKNHIKELDGLRGVAVLLVISSHAFSRAAYFTQNPVLLSFTELTTVGWVGVDIFFTLSGFLITGILLRAREKGNYFKNFYARRILRIFPLYYLAIAAVLLFAPKIEPEFMSHLSKILPIMLLYQQNWLFLGDMQMTQYLSVTWSLAIEEQFYILWPFIVYFAKREKLIKLTVWIIVLSLLSRVLAALVWGHSSYFPLFFYSNSFTRFEEILIGALLAILFSDPGMTVFIRRYSLSAFLFTLSVFMLLCMLSYPNRPHPLFGNIPLTVFGYTTAALFTASLIGVFVTHPEGSLLRRIFSSAPLVFFGKYSYSMYLFHVSIVLVLLEYFWNSKMRGWNIYLLYAALVFLLTALVGWLTWHLLEKHILGLKKYFEE